MKGVVHEDGARKRAWIELRKLFEVNVRNVMLETTAPEIIPRARSPRRGRGKQTGRPSFTKERLLTDWIAVIHNLFVAFPQIFVVFVAVSTLFGGAPPFSAGPLGSPLGRLSGSCGGPHRCFIYTSSWLRIVFWFVVSWDGSIFSNRPRLLWGGR